MERPQADWHACTWEGAREDVLRLGRSMTFREKVIWLEQAARLSMAIRGGRPAPALRPTEDADPSPARTNRI